MMNINRKGIVTGQSANGHNCYRGRKMGVTADGIPVYDRPNSHFHPEGGLTFPLLSEAISKISLYGKGNFIKEVVKFDEAVGFTTCVEVKEDDEVVWVHRAGRGTGLTPMVKNRVPEPCDSITVILLRKGRNVILVTAFVGGRSEKEPWDPHIEDEEERQRCVAFWKKHALIYDESLVAS